MAQRRTFGAIRKLKSGRWQASYLDPVTRARVPGESTFPTKADADLWLASMELSLQRGDNLDRSGRITTLEKYAHIWLSGKTALRPSTVELYQYLLRSHIFPTLGKAPLTAITPGSIRVWNSQLRSGSIGNVTAAKAYRLLHQIMRAAVDDRLIYTNPCAIKGAGVEHSRERAIPSVTDVFRLADAIDGRYRAMVLLAAFAGLRRGECLGLTESHLDLEGTPPTVTIAQSLSRTMSKGFILQPPKTNAGNRTVAISQRLATELAAHLVNFPADDPSSLIFPVRSPGERGLRQAWELAGEQTGVTCTFHDLRHLAGTLNAAAGATLKESMARMGHTSSDAALRYQHAVVERDSVIAVAIEELIAAGDPSLQSGD